MHSLETACCVKARSRPFYRWLSVHSSVRWPEARGCRLSAALWVLVGRLVPCAVSRTWARSSGRPCASPGGCASSLAALWPPVPHSVPCTTYSEGFHLMGVFKKIFTVIRERFLTINFVEIFEEPENQMPRAQNCSAGSLCSCPRKVSGGVHGAMGRGSAIHGLLIFGALQYN